MLGYFFKPSLREYSPVHLFTATHNTHQHPYILAASVSLRMFSVKGTRDDVSEAVPRLCNGQAVLVHLMNELIFPFLCEPHLYSTANLKFAPLRRFQFEKSVINWRYQRSQQALLMVLFWVDCIACPDVSSGLTRVVAQYPQISPSRALKDFLDP